MLASQYASSVPTSRQYLPALRFSSRKLYANTGRLPVMLGMMALPKSCAESRSPPGSSCRGKTQVRDREMPMGQSARVGPIGMDVGQTGEDVLAEFGVEDVPSAPDVAVQGVGFVLDQDDDVAQPGVDAVAEGEVDDPVFAAEGDGGLGAVRRQRVEALAPPAGQNHGEEV